jgi:hypothetical protein
MRLEGLVDGAIRQVVREIGQDHPNTLPEILKRGFRTFRGGFGCVDWVQRHLGLLVWERLHRR